MKFTREALRDCLHDESEELELVGSKRAVSEGRWAVNYAQTFRVKATGKFYEMRYSRGTGDEGERPFESSVTPLDCPEVYPAERLQTVWLPAPDGADARPPSVVDLLREGSSLMLEAFSRNGALDQNLRGELFRWSADAVSASDRLTSNT